MATKPKKKAAPVKRTRDKEATKQALLEAAIEVFAEMGYDAATTREIAKRAGISEALIQRYFESKAGLLVAVITGFATHSEGENFATLPYPDQLKDELLQIILQSCNEHKENANFVRVAVSRAIIDPAVGKQVGANVHEKKIPMLVARLMHYQKIGVISKDQDLTALAFALSALSFTLGFMGPEVFGFDRNRIQGIATNIMGWLAKGVSST